MRSNHKLHRVTLGRGQTQSRRRRGFTMVECVVAILVINLTIAGMFKLLKLQERQVAEAEGWLKENPIYYLNPDPDPLARALGSPATMDEKPVARVWRPQAMPYTVRITDYRFELDPTVLRVEFEQRPAEEAEDAVESKKPDAEEKREKSKRKPREREFKEGDLMPEGKSRLRRNSDGDNQKGKKDKKGSKRRLKP